MKSLALQKLRNKLKTDHPVYGLWITLESASISEMAVALGLDWIVIDAEHGHLDWKEILEHVRATVRSDTVVLVRIAELNGGLIKRALDIGADGVVIPWVETADQLERAVALAKYPLEGVRGIGAERATCWGQCLAQHTEEANQQVLILPIIETVTARRNIQALCRVGGVELFFLGPADYSSSAGFRGQWEGPGVAEELRAIKDTVRANGKHCGVIATGDSDLGERLQQGFRMLGIGLDTGLLLRGLREALRVVGRERRIDSSFIPEWAGNTDPPLAQPPESMRPDRAEVMNRPCQSDPVELVPGVFLDCLVGQHNHARNLTVGWVTMEPGSTLPYHTHPVSEAITVLWGTVVVSVEGRDYSLGPLDNLVIPRGVAHSTRNPSAAERILLHVALASEVPSRAFVPAPSERRTMPADFPGIEGKERVTRFVSAPRFAPEPGTSFIDHFNRDLLPGIEMSGGYGLFQPGGRLRAHVHDFDESICIIQGTASCIVEGRRYTLANGATALQPRGRVHYFINDTQEPMAMLWVYAGPIPRRILVEERCATVAGNPWKDLERV